MVGEDCSRYGMAGEALITTVDAIEIVGGGVTTRPMGSCLTLCVTP